MLCFCQAEQPHRPASKGQEVQVLREGRYKLGLSLWQLLLLIRKLARRVMSLQKNSGAKDKPKP